MCKRPAMCRAFLIWLHCRPLFVTSQQEAIVAEVTCSRCGQTREAVKNTAFYTGETGRSLKEHACQECWNEWVKMQIMIINEYRLNLMDPQTDEFLNKQVLGFFKLDADGVAGVNYIPPEA
jgi:Fe-S cluster biosynthesis and repair protein YggX